MRLYFLDGMRGWAAIAVVLGHLIHNVIIAGHNPDYFIIFSDGQLAVYIFFVISGFALSISFFEGKDRLQLAKLLIARYFRLTIPIVAACFFSYALWSGGLLENHEVGRHFDAQIWLDSQFTPPLPSIAKLLCYSVYGVYFDFAALSFVNSALWTMQYELFGSLLLLVVLLVFGDMIGIVVIIVLSIYLQYVGSIVVALMYGALLAKAYAFKGHHLLMLAEKCPRKSRELVGFFIIGLACLLSSFRNYLGLAGNSGVTLIAFLLLLGVLLNSSFRNLFSSNLSRWIGRLSFPLYLTHLAIISSWMAWLILKLEPYSPLSFPVSTMVVVSTLILALATASAFSIVDRFAISLSNCIAINIMEKLKIKLALL